jgi:hypothetical protein
MYVLDNNFDQNDLMFHEQNLYFQTRDLLIKKLLFFFFMEMTKIICEVRRSTISCTHKDNVLIIFITVLCILSIDTGYNTIISFLLVNKINYNRFCTMYNVHIILLVNEKLRILK